MISTTEPSSQPVGNLLRAMASSESGLCVFRSPFTDHLNRFAKVVVIVEALILYGTRIHMGLTFAAEHNCGAKVV